MPVIHTLTAVYVPVYVPCHCLLCDISMCASYSNSLCCGCTEFSFCLLI